MVDDPRDHPTVPPREQLDQILPDLYEQLRQIASRELRSERRDHTLQTTALVHEAYLRLAGQREIDWASRGQILSAAASAMRRILVDHARQHAAAKRGGGRLKVALADFDHLADDQSEDPDIDLVALDDALDRLATLSRRQARTVELRYFGGLTVEEAAKELGSSTATISRDWKLAKAWLYRELAGAC